MSDNPVLSFRFRLRFEDFEVALAHDMRLVGITALFGHSGSGKSSTLRVLAGLETEADGTISFDGEPWQSPAPDNVFIPPHQRCVGFVFQDAALFPHLSVAGNLAYAESRACQRQNTTDLAKVVDRLDLEPLLQRHPTSLSGGERQRVALGRALLTRPRLMLLDEPMSALDTRRKAEILPYIAGLPAEFGVPVIYVTHSVDEVAYLADTMIVLSKGRKVADGPVAQTLARLDLGPATGRFEAGVVLDARIEGHDREFYLTNLDVGGATLSVPLVDAAIGTPVRLRIRARDVILARVEPKQISSRNVLRGTIQEIAEEPETPFAETLVDVPGGVIRARLTRASVADLELSPGTPVYALIKSISLVGSVAAIRN
ncbi:MAG: molybdenum ABC transporter ATP-binding protein [Alphaproteobacteria bacterium]|nr:molybdenum ABC transporter ATP-binding protein [Alphaproteobacteria bacterium]